jgi:hypothetical protein
MPVATSFNVTATQGARENLANTLRFVEPTTTPLYSTLAHSAAPKAVLTEWLADVLGNPDIAGELDGTDLAFNTDFTDQINSRVRLGNRVQTVRNAYAVSRQAQMISVAPGESLTAASKAKSLLELKRSLESVIGSGESQRAGSGSVTAKSQGLGIWTDPAAAVADVPASVLAVSGSRFDLSASAGAAVMVESDLRSLLQSVYEASGTKSDYRLMAGPAVVNEISDFSRANANSAAFNQDVGGGRLSLSITEYNSSYGTLKVIPDLFLGRAEGQAITGATNATPIVVTATAHGFENGDIVTISGVGGNLAANGSFLVAGKTANTINLQTRAAANVAGTGTYTALTGTLTAGNNTAQGVLNSRRAYLIPGDDTVSLKFLEGITTQNLPDLGGGPRAFVEAMITLCVTNPRALGSIV